ncbi:MAG TPA: hypothetical protein PKN48_15835 [Bacteroidales bacterium]|nr:hypothetical protein [Bacteroidales bacterium]
MKTTFTKIIFSLFFLLIIGYSFAQSPQAFNYQAVARDVSGNVLAAQALGVKISLHMTSATGPEVYSETHSPTTNPFGLFTLEIGSGTIVDGQFDTIAWGKNQYWMHVEMDPAGGTTYTDMGTTQLLSVPYAMYAEKSRTVAASYANSPLPIAYGFVESAGTLAAGTSNISNITWNASSSRYEITIAGESYFYNDYVTIVTVCGTGQITVETSSVSGKLLVYLYNAAGTKVQNMFQFVTYKP